MSDILLMLYGTFVVAPVAVIAAITAVYCFEWIVFTISLRNRAQEDSASE